MGRERTASMMESNIAKHTILHALCEETLSFLCELSIPDGPNALPPPPNRG